MTTVFVFGTNRQGRHGKGAALEAVHKWGAAYGQAESRQGNAYGIVTKELRRGFPPVTLEEVAEGVRRFLEYASSHPDVTFLLTAVGCGLAGFTPEQVAPLFAEAPANVELPELFRVVLEARGDRQPTRFRPTGGT